MKIITRQEALEKGLKTFFTGRPCKRGNLAERNTKCNYCMCADCYALRASRSKAWRKENPEKQAACDRAWVAANPEKARACWKRAEEQKRARAAVDPEFRERRQARARKRSMKHHNKMYGNCPEFTERVKANAANQKVLRRRQKKAVELTDEQEAQVKAIYALRYRLSANTGTEFHVDHRIPLSKGGLHVPENLWVIPAIENLRKGDRIQ